jgi:hypothetical protein
MKISTLKTHQQTPRSEAIELVFDYFANMVNPKTDPIDFKRFMIIAIHQAQRYAMLVDNFDLLNELNSMEARWYRGEL